ncbi:MAG: N-acetyltransferase [Candidatus Nealsonbacteria bacterium]|nr:N-acetyltransferase [Candidatus Nealsonbacteria bacterium]
MNHFDPWLIRPVSEPWYVQAVVIFGVGCTLYVAWRLVGRAVVWASHSGFALLTVGRSLEPPLNSSGGSIADKEKKLHIREARESDLNDVLSVEREAFGHTKEAELVRELLEDPSAQPVLSLLALEDDRAVGHILFTAVHLENTEDTASMAILAPLAIVPAAQKQGIGGKLIQEGLQLLAKSGVDIVLVLGHPEYYPRYGFRPAERLGFEAPYPIPEEHADAWMVQELRPNRIGSIRGKVVCADTLSKPEHWRE